MSRLPDLRFLSVRQKAQGLVLLFSLSLLGVLIPLLGGQLLRWADVQETIAFGDQTQAVLGDLKRQQQSLGFSAEDWAAWGEAQQFVLGRSPQFLERNAAPSAMHRLNVNLIVYSTLEGQLRGVRWQTAAARQAQVPDFWPQAVASLHLERLKAGQSLDAAVNVLSGQGPSGLLLIAVRPVTDDDGQGRSGRLIMGRLTRLVTPRSSDFHAELTAAQGSERLGIFNSSNALIGGHVLVAQLPASPLLLDVHAPRRLHLQALWLVIGLAGVVMVTVLLYAWGGLHLFDRLLLGRLRRLQHSVNTIEAQSSVSPITIQGHDELDTLALAFNGMLERLGAAHAEGVARQSVLRQVAEAQPLSAVGAQVLSLLELQLGGWVSLELGLGGKRLQFESQQHAAPLNVREVPLSGAGGESYGLIRVGRAAPPEAVVNSAELLVMAAQQHELRDQLRDRALLDPLTGLLGSWGLNQRLEADMQRGPLAALQLNLDRFKRLNDTVGTAAGDELLRLLAERIQVSLSGEMYAGRLYGDKFLVVLPGVVGAEQARGAAQALLACLSGPVQLSGYRLQVSARIGLSLWPEQASSVSELLRFTDLAMPQPDDQVRIGVFTPELRERVSEQLQLETDLRLALEQVLSPDPGEPGTGLAGTGLHGAGQYGAGLHGAGQYETGLHLAYQPQIDLDSGLVVGVEALARWAHPQLGAVAPDRFIALAEESGLMLSLGEWVLRRACTQLAQWHAEGLRLRMAVNVSAQQFTTGELPAQVASALRAAKLSPEYLTLEVTESLLMPGDTHAHRQLHALAAQGVKLAIDDFGTGYSSLSYLSRMPIHVLKIDRSFVRDLGGSQGLSALTHTLVNLGQQLGLVVVAEGIETPQQAELLREWSCPLGQGFLYAQALSPRALEDHCRLQGAAAPGGELPLPGPPLY
ncbi:EAL domain-containing protein [Deinococcus sp.]|uniref:bifunctional diguanylate cyclase/phosphodiesterase n=1 Tax=Deinococcus sp. TaxID=47478 RepID=UPI0025F15CFD|nr:EAL domain-containing protein [Deinococcus sp.]